MANSVDPEQTAPIGAVCSGSTLLASLLNSSVMLGNYLQQTSSADDIFRGRIFLGALRVKWYLQSKNTSQKGLNPTTNLFIGISIEKKHALRWQSIINLERAI